jgi:hypothetical protein
VSGPTFTEVKHHFDGRTEEWSCQAITVTDDLAAVRFRLPDPVSDVPAGTLTLGFFWRDRTYNLYRFLSADGEPFGYRFDVVTDVRIEPDRVEYLDLLLDVRVLPDGTVRVEDEEEVEEAARRGLLSPEQDSIIGRTREHLLDQHAHIVDEALRLVD